MDCAVFIYGKHETDKTRPGFFGPLFIKRSKIRRTGIRMNKRRHIAAYDLMMQVIVIYARRWQSTFCDLQQQIMGRINQNILRSFDLSMIPCPGISMTITRGISLIPGHVARLYATTFLRKNIFILRFHYSISAFSQVCVSSRSVAVARRRRGRGAEGMWIALWPGFQWTSAANAR